MISGHKTLGFLDQGLKSVRLEINRIDNELNQVSETLHSNRRSQAQTLKALAKVRLDELSQGSFLGDLEAADQRALKILEQRQHAYESLERHIADITQSLDDMENTRETALQQVHIHAQTIIDCEHLLQTRLEADQHFQQQLLQTTKQDSIANEAEKKAKIAQQDRLDKGAPYEQNKLFMYLWQRHYGTSAYQANPLSRFLDRWIEQYCDYDRYRVNYWTLLEIPKRLHTHAQNVRANAEQALAALTELETNQAEEAGLPALQQNHTTSLNVIDDIDDSIELKEANMSELLQRRTEFAEAKDTYMEQSLKTLVDSLGTKDIHQLDSAAFETSDNQDNLMVRELAELREQHIDLHDELGDHRLMHEAKLKRLQELEGLRRQFKNHRFDDIRSAFGNEGLITSMLGQFLSGLINSSEFWRVLQRHQRHRDVGAWPDFGSGGLGRSSRRRSPWHIPSGRGRIGGGFRLPKSGGWSSRGSGGGFRTGGGF